MKTHLAYIGWKECWLKHTLQIFSLVLIMCTLSVSVRSQEISFFTEGTSDSYYDQGIVDVANLGGSLFEYTYPPGSPQWNDKVPCSINAFKGSTALKFYYTSAVKGNWKVTIYRNDWSVADITKMDSIAMYIYCDIDIPQTALPKIGIKTSALTGSTDIESKLYPLSVYNKTVIGKQWKRISFPISVFVKESNLNLSSVKGIIFNQSEANNTSRKILIDEIVAFKSIVSVPTVTNLLAVGYDSHTELTWDIPMDNLTYQVFASFDNGANYELRGTTTNNYFFDFITSANRNKKIYYKIVSSAQGVVSAPAETNTSIHDFSDDQLLEMLEKYTFRYFWEGANPKSGAALERSNGSDNTVATGATGMGLLAMIVAHEREWKPKTEIKERILKILTFLEKCDHFHGAFSHWYDGNTNKTIPFSDKDNGGDLVETAYLSEGLIAVKNYFSGEDSLSVNIRIKADVLWQAIEWDWFRNNNQNVLYWHWSPNYNFGMNMKISGWNECLATYIMAASSPLHSIPSSVYDQGWAQNGNIVNKRTFYSIPITLSPDYGGPLFWTHYSFLGINPKVLSDKYANYWQENVNTAKIHYAYSVANPKKHKNYGENCWGLTASDDPYGYTAHQPMSNDNGTITPSAALSSLPYTPEESMKALKYFYRERGSTLFGKYGFFDAFNDDLNWVQKAYLGIDQGPIIIMIENYRTQLLWNLVMNDTDIKNGLTKLGFQYQTKKSFYNLKNKTEVSYDANSSTLRIGIYPDTSKPPFKVSLFSIDGRLVDSKTFSSSTIYFPITDLRYKDRCYLIKITNSNYCWNTKVLINQ